MSDINFRIKTLRDYFANENNSDFAAMVDSSEANIRNYIKNTEPKAKFLATICEELDVNSEWLLLGKGEMLNKNEIDKPKSITDKSQLSKENTSPSEIIRIFADQLQKNEAIGILQSRQIEVLTNKISKLEEDLNNLKSSIKI